MECLCSLTPLFFLSPDEAARSDGFVASLLALTEAERSMLQKARGLVREEFPGRVIRDLGNMVQKQVSSFKRCEETKLLVEVLSITLFHPSRYGFDSPTPVILFWLKAFSKLPGWSDSREALHVIEILCQEGFFNKSCFQTVMAFFSDVYEV